MVTRRQRGVLMEWLEEGGGDGYAQWRNAGPKTAGKAKSNGKTKMKIAGEIATALEVADRLNRTREGVTGVDEVQGHRSIGDVVDEACPNFERLHAFMGDRVANNPPYTGSTGDGVDAAAILMAPGEGHVDIDEDADEENDLPARIRRVAGPADVDKEGDGENLDGGVRGAVGAGEDGGNVNGTPARAGGRGLEAAKAKTPAAKKAKGKRSLTIEFGDLGNRIQPPVCVVTK
ncbi:hypothetical protein HK102_012661 [Quaeritorhiza haematococci]|nr:hypothetical protein HK102_012661 [Quaeritorhiza haematococci]